ncbi:MAG: hypothetical protein IJW98_02985 [Clostridia bacterium]|nr:hypothetical protein [Clostridia bacterium]
MKQNLTLIYIKTMIRSKWKTVLLTFIVLAVSVLSLFVSAKGLESYVWTLEVRSMDYFSLYNHPDLYDQPDSNRKPYSLELDDGKYETIPLPDGASSEMMYDAIQNQRMYGKLLPCDDLLYKDGEPAYLLFYDPFETGEDVMLLVRYPDVPHGLFSDFGRPFAYYVREVSEQ